MSFTEDERRAPLRTLLAEAPPDQAPAATPTRAHGSGEAGASGGGGGGGGAGAGEPVEELSGTQLRDRLIARDPLDAGWIARVNQVRPQPQPGRGWPLAVAP